MSIVLPYPTTAFQINALLMYFGEDSLRPVDLLSKASNMQHSFQGFNNLGGW